jgi:hypothetical protein
MSAHQGAAATMEDAGNSLVVPHTVVRALQRSHRLIIGSIHSKANAFLPDLSTACTLPSVTTQLHVWCLVVLPIALTLFLVLRETFCATGLLTWVTLPLLSFYGAQRQGCPVQVVHLVVHPAVQAVHLAVHLAVAALLAVLTFGRVARPSGKVHGHVVTCLLCIKRKAAQPPRLHHTLDVRFIYPCELNYIARACKVLSTGSATPTLHP